MIIRVLKMLKLLNPELLFNAKIVVSNVLFKGAKNDDNVADKA